MGMHVRIWLCGSLATVLLLVAAPALADIAVSSNDGHTALIDGTPGARPDPTPDTLSVIDLARFPPRVVATIDVPGSVVGPPMAVAVAADESFAIVTSATKADPQATAKVSPDDRVSLVDLKASPPVIVQQVAAGAGATVVRITPDGKLSLVANRMEGTVSVFRIAARRLEPIGKLDLGNPKSGPSGIAILPDGKTALLSRDGDHIVNVLHIDGERVTLDSRPITTALKPYTLDINKSGTLAAVSNMGRVDGDVDTVSLIDLTATPFRTVETISVGRVPEGLKFSPDGKMLAVGTQEGSGKPANSPFHTEHGRLQLFAVEGQHLRQLGEASIGGWTQGIVFGKDGKTVLAQNMTEHTISVFRIVKARLVEAPPLATGAAAPAAIQASWP